MLRLDHKITLDELKSHTDDVSYIFVLQAINDLWANYIFKELNLYDADVNQVDLDDVGYFREWCDAEGYFFVEQCLPESDSLMQAIIKYAISVVVD